VFVKPPPGTSKGRLVWREPFVWAAADTFGLVPGAALPLALKIKGSGRYAPGQTEAGALADLQGVLRALEKRHPGLKATVQTESQAGRVTMPSFEVAQDSPIVQALNASYAAVRGERQPTGAIIPPGFYGTDAAHLYRMGGMSGVVCGPGGRYNTMPDECVDVDDYLDMIRIYILTILQICE
jgi:acetylornithine deacetylase